MPLDGQIDEHLPDGRFGFMPENGHRILAHPVGRMRKFRVRLTVGDRVSVEITLRGLEKGRIIFVK